LFSFASEHTIVGVLLQKDEQNFERPIAYYSRTLRDSPLKYDIMEKQAYALVKALKEFRVYILHSHTIAYVPNSSVKDILTQPDPEGKRGKWIVVLLEYDLEIKPTKLIKGQGLAKLMAQTNCELLGINFIVDLSADSEEEKVPQVSQKFLDSHDISSNYPSYHKKLVARILVGSERYACLPSFFKRAIPPSSDLETRKCNKFPITALASISS
jgi:hypothetical protein